jgi:hypothetical protein
MDQLQNIKEFLKVKLPIQYINNVLNSIPRKFIIEKYNYDVLKIIPYKSSYTDKEYEKIINTIAKYNKPFLDRFELRTDKKTLVYHPEQPISFEALYTKDKISYFYAMPTIYRNVFYNKLKFLLDKSDIVQVEDPISSFKGSLKQSFEYKKNWIFAINTNDKLNIADNLLVLHKDLQTDNDQILMQLLMQPQFDYQWKNKWETQYKKFSETGLISNGANIWENIDSIFNFVMLQTDYIINAVMLAIAGEEPLTIENQNLTIQKT